MRRARLWRGEAPLKVLGFDNWTGGAHLFERLVPAFSETGLDLALLHLGSWGNDPGRPTEETLGGLRIRDIAYYDRAGYAQILDVERPDAVLFMSTDTFAHRAFNRYCRLRGIPTVHVFHGLVQVQAVDGGTPYRVNALAQAKYAVSKLSKALTHVWPAYAGALRDTGAAATDWLRFGSDVFRGALGRWTTVSADDARTDRCCVYVGADVDYALGKYGFVAEDVIPVGNPDLARFGLTAERVGAGIARTHAQAADVMYADTGLMFTGCVFTSAEEFVRHMLDTRDALAAQGRKLVFKPHPDHRRSNVLGTLAEAGVDICGNDEFVPRLERCCACIVEPSTVAVIPALLGMPVALAKYGSLRDQSFGPVMTSYPRARELRDVRKLDALVHDVDARPQREAAMAWIRENAGPLPAEDMPRRVAGVFASLLGAPLPRAGRPNDEACLTG